MKRIKGHKIIIKPDGKLFAGTTDLDMSMKPEFETSITKEDAGKPKKEIIDCPIEFSISGLFSVNETGEESTHMDVPTARAIVKAGSLIPFVYGGTESGDAIISGNMRIIDYKETTGSKETGQVSLTCETEGDYTLGVVTP